MASKPPGSVEETTITRTYGLGWVRYLDDDIRIDLIEGDQRALGHAYRWLGASPAVRDVQGSEWRSSPLCLTPGHLIELTLPQHLILHARTAHDRVLSDTSWAVEMMTKLVLVTRQAARGGGGFRSGER